MLIYQSRDGLKNDVTRRLETAFVTVEVLSAHEMIPVLTIVFRRTLKTCDWFYASPTERTRFYDGSRHARLFGTMIIL